MGCCGDNIQFSTINFTLELYDLIQNKEKITQFEIKKLSSTNIEKIFGKNLSTYIEETKICKDLGEDFKFTINNSLFYCYLNRNYAIVKNYLQVKDLVPMSYETLFKISIVLMSNYNQLYMPKINFANKTKNEIDLDGIKVDFSDVMLSNKYIFDPNISKDRIIMAKPKFEEAILHIDENNESDNSDSESQSKKSSQENNSSVYEENSDVDSEEEEEKEEEKNAKNYLLIKDEVSPDVVKTVFEAISPYLEEDEDDFINVKKEDKGGNLRRFRRFQSSVGSSVELKQTNNFNRRVSVMNNKIVVAKKGDELKLNLFNNEEERNKKQQEQEEEQKKIINSVFIESAKITDLDVFSEMIGILAIYSINSKNKKQKITKNNIFAKE